MRRRYSREQRSVIRSLIHILIGSTPVTTSIADDKELALAPIILLKHWTCILFNLSKYFALADVQTGLAYSKWGQTRDLYNWTGRLKTQNWTSRDHQNCWSDIARLDNARPYSKGGHRKTWQRGTRSNIGVHFLCCMDYYMNFIYHFVIVFFVICACILLY